MLDGETQPGRRADKRLDRMDRMADLFHFPAAVQAGAALNVVVTAAVTWWVAVRFVGPLVPFAWIAVVLVANLLPVAVLRLTTKPAEPMPTLRTMNFFRDQHRFSDWVYLAASAHMAAWVLLSWGLSLAAHRGGVLAGLLVAAAVETMSPVLLRGHNGQGACAR